MNKFNKKNIIIYIFLIIYLIIGKFFLEPNYFNLYSNLYNPIILFIIALLTFFFNKNNIDRFKKKKDLLETIIIIMMFYMIIYFVSGLFFNYAYSPYNHSFLGIIKNIWCFITIIIFQEYIRYNLVKDNDSKIIYILIMILFIAIELNFASFNNSLESNEAIFKYITSIIVPIICHNVVANYLVLRGNYKCSIIYLVSLELLLILLPIYPDLDWFFVSLYEIILAIIIYAFTSDFYENKVLRKRKNRKYKSHIMTYIPYLILIIVVVLFMGGFFKYKPIAIISNSMYPNIKRGDTVISEKITKKDLKSIRLNDIIEYRLGGASVIHRVVAIDLTIDGKRVFVTKGDNNNDIDDEKVTEEQIIGIVNVKIPYVGYPTVWLSEVLNEKTPPQVELGD